MLLLGSETTQATAHATTAEKVEVYEYVASETGLIESLSLFTNGTANTGVTAVWLGIYAEEEQSAKKAAGLMQAVKVSGTPAINSTITATGFSVPVISGKRYWLAVLSLGGALHFNVNGAGGENAKATFSTSSMRPINGGGLTAVVGTGGTPKFTAEGPAIGSARDLIFGVQNATNHVSLWAPKNVRYTRGNSVAETDLTEAGEKSPAEISALVGTAITDGFTSPGVVLNVEKLLSTVNTTTYAEKFAAIVKKVKEDHPGVNVYYDLINEPQSKGPHAKSNASDYAAIVKAVIEKLRAEGLYSSPNVTILVTAMGTYEKVNAEGVGTEFSNVWQGNGWIHDMFAAQPSLKSGGENEVKAWVSHNYGRAAEITSQVQGGIPAAVNLRQLVIEEGGGGFNNWYINEFGFALTAEAKGRNVSSEAEQKTCVEEYVKAAQCLGEAGWLKLINIFADGTSEWGVNGKPAGTFYAEYAETHALAAGPELVKPANVSLEEKWGEYFIIVENTGGIPTGAELAGEVPTGMSVAISGSNLEITGNTHGLTVKAYKVKVKAKNALGSSETEFTFTIQINKPEISGTVVAGIINKAIPPFTLSNAGGAPEAGGWSMTGAPPGVSIDSNSGQISGTPTSTGEFKASVKAKNASGTSTAPVTFNIEAQQRASIIVEAPPLRTITTITLPNGGTSRWASDSPDPATVPVEESWSTIMPGGYERYQASLERDPRKAYQDTEELATLTVSGVGGDVAWEGRLEKDPRTGGWQEQSNPEAVGWQTHLEDDATASLVVIDRDLTRWGEMSRARRAGLLASDIRLATAPFLVAPDVVNGLPALVLQVEGPFETEAGKPRPLSESWYDAGAGNLISKIFYDYEAGAESQDGGVSWTDLLFGSLDDTGGTTVSSANLNGAVKSNQTFTLSTFYRYLIAQHYNNLNKPNFKTNFAYSAYLKNLAVVGAHGLPVQGSGSANLGFLASDIAPYVLGKWAPKLNFSVGSGGTIQPSFFIIPHLVFYEQTTAAEILKQAFRFELLDWAVWENKTFYLNERGGRGSQWRARIGPAQLQQTGKQVSRLWNGVVVSFTDETGRVRTVGPLGSGCDQTSTLLEDNDPENPLNEEEIPKYAQLKMGVSTFSGATKVGQIFLTETKGLDTSGQATLVGVVEDTNGGLWPYWQVKAGDTISFVDASDPSPRRIVHTDCDGPSRSNTIQLDQPAEGLQAVLERLSVVLVPLGLS